MSGEEVTVNDWLIEAAGEDDIERARNYRNAYGESFFNSSKPLHLAAEGCFFNICKFLIEKRGVDVNELDSRGKTPLYLVCSPFFKGNGKEKAKILNLLCNNGAGIDITSPNGDTVLHFATSNKNKAFVDFLLDGGIDVNIRRRDGSTALHVVLGSGPEVKDIVETLCQNGADVNARNNNGWTPLHEHAFWEPTEATVIMKTLLKFGANINAQGNSNETALHCVFTDPDVDIATLLLDNGCDINIETIGGKTALDTIIARGERAVDEFEHERLINIFRGIHDDAPADDNYQPDLLRSVQTLKRHLVKLKTAKLFVSRKNLSHLESIDLSDFEERCREEISAAQSEELQPGITLFDILSAGVDPTYAKNKLLMEALNRFNWDSFPLYKSIILNNVKKSKLRHDLLESGEKRLCILLRTSSILNEFSIPAEIMSTDILSLIVSFLSNEELKALITCGDELQRQFVHSSSDIGSSTP